MQNKSMLTQDTQFQSESNDSSLLELSAREVKALMQRFGVRSEACPEELEALDLLLALQQDAKNLIPPPQFVPVSGRYIH